MCVCVLVLMLTAMVTAIVVGLYFLNKTSPDVASSITEVIVDQIKRKDVTSVPKFHTVSYSCYFVFKYLYISYKIIEMVIKFEGFILIISYFSWCA